MGKIVLVSSFCTNLRIAKCSFTLSKLRFRYLASHKNNLTIDDFLFWQSSGELFLHECVGRQNAHIGSVRIR